MSRHLRVFWVLWGLVAALLGAVRLGPLVEAWGWPVRSAQGVTAIARVDGYLAFEWDSEKRRTPPFEGVTLTLETPHDTYFGLSLERDLATPPEPRCSRRGPWARSRIPPPGTWQDRLCVELPPTVGAADPATLRVVLHYAGWHGLWSLPQPLPPVRSEARREP